MKSKGLGDTIEKVTKATGIKAVVKKVAGEIYVLRLLGVAGSGQPAHDRALMLLKERYAKGEIDTLEFEERKKLLAH